MILASTSAYMGPPANWQGRIEGLPVHGVAPLAQASIVRWFTPEIADDAHLQVLVPAAHLSNVEQHEAFLAAALGFPQA